MKNVLPYYIALSISLIAILKSTLCYFNNTSIDVVSYFVIVVMLVLVSVYGIILDVKNKVK